MFSPVQKVSVIIGIIFCLFSSAFAYPGGSGTEIDPYRIAAVSDWQQLMSTSSDWNKYFIMTADVNLQGVTLVPVGNFTGVFDGNGHIICNAVMNKPASDYVGLFGYVGTGGQICNLGIEDVNITSRRYVGGLVGYNYSGTITACYATGVVKGGDFIGGLGGLVGSNWRGIITNCYAAGAVNGTKYVGGLVGENDGNLANCYSTGEVSGNNSVGGLVGGSFSLIYNNSTIVDCYATGAVKGDSYVGGLVGDNGSYDIRYLESTTITGCYATGAVEGDSYVGGLVGRNKDSSPFLNHITNCYSTGTVNGNNIVGGLVGGNCKCEFYDCHGGSAITGCYATGAVTGNEDVGGLMGINEEGAVTDCCATGAVTGNENVGGLLGRNTGYSYKMGTISNCYATGIVTGSGHTGRLVGGCTGGLVGCNKGYTITGCYAIGDVNVVRDNPRRGVGGLIGENYGCTIIDCYAIGNVNVESVRSGSGGLVGGNYLGIIIASYATGTVSGNRNVGGLVGMQGDSKYYRGGTIIACYATGAVSGDSCLGGLVGGNSEGCTITDCYSTGTVSGFDYVGGLVGENWDASIMNCYATGAVTGDKNVGGLVGGGYSGTTNTSFWDIETSGRTTSAGGEGKTTAQMQDINTFLNAGWDFVGETANGTEDIWTICEGVNYPRFVWQNQPPTAEAGPDQTAYAWIDDGMAEVELDGSASSDIDECNELTYYWSWVIDGNTDEAEGANPTIELPVGVHTIELIVNDGLADSEPDYVDVNVIAPLKADLSIVPSVVNRSSHLQNIMTVMEMPKGIKRTDVSSEPFVLYPADSEEGIEAVRQYVLPCWRRGVRVIALFSKDELMDIVPDSGRVELQVVSQLNSGQYVFGDDSIRIIGRHPFWWRWRWHK